MNTNNILVTGGTGNVGSQALRPLLGRAPRDIAAFAKEVLAPAAAAMTTAQRAA